MPKKPEATPLLADGFRLEEKLGMIELTISDQYEKPHAFWFLPARFQGFLTFVAAFAPPAGAKVFGGLAATSARAKAADASRIRDAAARAASAEPGFAVYSDAVKKLAYLHLRQGDGEEACLVMDRTELQLLTAHLIEAKNVLLMAERSAH